MLDLYGGAGIYYYRWKFDNELYKADNNADFSIGIQLGGGYAFDEQLSANLELGSGNANSTAKLGISYGLR